MVDEVKVGEDEETLLEEETAGKKRVKENGMLGVARDAGICRDMQHNTCHGSGSKQHPTGTPSARETSERPYTGLEQHPSSKTYSGLPFGFRE